MATTSSLSRRSLGFGRLSVESAPRFPPRVLQCDETGDTRQQRQRQLRTRDKVDQRGVRRDQNHDRDDRDPFARGEAMTLHRFTPALRPRRTEDC